MQVRELTSFHLLEHKNGPPAGASFGAKVFRSGEVAVPIPPFTAEW